MSTPNYGDDYEYASSRLRGSVVRINNPDKDIFYVSDICCEEGLLYGEILTEDGPKNGNDKFTVEDVDTTPVTLGYINKGRHCGYFARWPTRFYKQGLTSTSFCNWSGNITVTFTSLMAVRAMKNIYPKLTELLEPLVCGEISSFAFSRSFAASNINEELKLMYRDKIVGSINMENKHMAFPVLDAEHDFLQGILEEEYNVH